MPSITSKKIILRDGRFFLETLVENTVDLGTQEFHLAQMMKPSAVFTPAFASIGDRNCHMVATPPNPATGISASWVVFARLTKLPFRSAFTQSTSADGVMRYVPLSNPVPRASAEKCFKDADFPIPDTWGKCWFLTQFLPGIGAQVRPAKCYLFITRGNDAYWMAYPNIHNNSMVCMGRDWDASPSGGQTTMILQFMHCLNTFFSTDMNADLSTRDTHRQFSRSVNEPHNWEYAYRPTTLLSNAILAPLSSIPGGIGHLS